MQTGSTAIDRDAVAKAIVRKYAYLEEAAKGAMLS
jgi:hypothetical protein